MNIDERIELTKQTLDAMERCRNGVPDGFALECKTYSETWCLAPHPKWASLHYRLVELPKPKRVPLEESDVIVSKTIIKSDKLTTTLRATGFGGVTVTSVNLDFGGGKAIDHSYSFAQLQSMNATYSNDHGATWQHCSKVVP